MWEIPTGELADMHKMSMKRRFSLARVTWSNIMEIMYITLRNDIMHSHVHHVSMIGACVVAVR